MVMMEGVAGTTPPTTPLPPPADCQWGRYNVNYLEAEGETTTLPLPVAVGHLRPSTAAAVSAADSQILSPPPTAEAIRLKRHSSDVTASRTTRATAGVSANNSSGRNSTAKRSNRVARRKSEVSGSCSIAAVAKNQLQHKQHKTVALSLLPPSTKTTTTTKTSCLRHQDDRGPETTPNDCHIVVNSRNSDLIVLKTRPLTKNKRVAFSDAPAIIWTDRRSPTAASTVVFVNNTSGGGGGHQHHLISPSHQTCSNNQKCNDLAGLERAVGVAAVDGSTDSSANNSSSSSTVEEVLTPKERRRRKVVMAVVCTTFILLTASALFVLITLFNASAIDEAVKRENESMQTPLGTGTAAGNGSDMITTAGGLTTTAATTPNGLFTTDAAATGRLNTTV